MVDEELRPLCDVVDNEGGSLPTINQRLRERIGDLLELSLVLW